ncbi:MAG: 7-carboxy-7-deazaguanine synthase QueE [Gammaproteobacteria bacterium]|nr:7-carboxy-7-deazaguanine synthase QueE [Gammaproteobacteria bacterium]
MNRLRITEIFFSLQGETRTVGLPTIFIRLTGCPLRCTYCDTAYAFQGGEWHAFDQIFQRIAQYKARHITVTGGEPLAQPACIPLLQRLCDAGYAVSLETSGALDISAVDTRVMRVLDIKTPGSKESDKNLFSNMVHLTSHDQIKFVICDRADYDWAKDIMGQYDLLNRCEILFSPSWGVLPAGDLADWIVVDQLPVRLQVQLHKYLWGDVRGR